MNRPYSEAWRRSVVTSYDSGPPSYSAHRRMQDANYVRLMAHLTESAGASLRPAKVLDVGCGDGQLASLIIRDIKLSDTKLFGVDPAVELLRHGRQIGSQLTLAAGDARALPYRASSFELVVSNSVLHWLNVPEHGLTPFDGIQEVARVLSPHGIFGASIAAVETAVEFGRAYHHVAAAYRGQGVTLTDGYREDPVGGMTLPTVVEDLRRAGLVVLRAVMEYEPVVYPSAAAYVDDVRSYGLGAFTAAFPEPVRLQAFTDIERQFLDRSGVGEYLHQQYMLYVVAKRCAIE